MRVTINSIKVRTVRSEKNDCAVFAIMSAAGIPYSQAHQALKNVGRVKGQGTPISMIAGALRGLGMSPMVYMLAGKATVARAVKMHQKGRFIVFTSDHAMGLRDGMLFDNANTQGKRHIEGIIALDGSL
jgi:hypothetical protein